MSEQKLAELIREIQPATFSEQVHGEGYRVVCGKNNSILLYKERGPFDFLMSWGCGEKQFYVRKLAIPLEINNWHFRWSEGTSAIALDFESSFQIQVETPDAAKRLVEKLAKADDLSAALRGLITRHLCSALDEMLLDCTSSQDGAPKSNLLSKFRTSSLGVGESESLNKSVTKAVKEELAGTLFRIGFRVINIPPMQISIRQEDIFTLGDSDKERKVITTALLELDNYQNFRKSGLHNEAAVREAVSDSIRQAVRRHFFAKQYYSVVESFAGVHDSIERQMKEQIAADAVKIGYRLNMFQAFPDIAALTLIHGQRIDLSPEECKYKPKNSNGFVQISLAIKVKATGFKDLGGLIHPDVMEVDVPIRKLIVQTCRDQIQRIDSTQFNLKFEEIVEPKIKKSIIAELKSYDIAAEVVYVRQQPTEEAARYAAICGQPRSFEVNIPPQADAGDADEVQITGRVEVTDMADGGWEQFVRKNYGYRSDAHMSLQQMRHLAMEMGIEVPSETSMSDEHRQSLAIEIELAAIRREVVSAIRGSLVTESDLAAQTRTETGCSHIHKKIHAAAAEAVQQAFGLVIKLYGLGRCSTPTEITLQTRRYETLRLVRERAVLQRDAEINRFNRLEEEKLEGISKIYRTRCLLQQTLTEDVEADKQRIDEWLQADQLPSNGQSDVSYDAGMKILAAEKKSSQGRNTARPITDESAEEK